MKTTRQFRLCFAMIAAAALSGWVNPAAMASINDNACEATTLSTSARVSASDGTEFNVETRYKSPFQALYVRTGEGASQLAVEGPTDWTEQDGTMSDGSDFTRLFVLGHQYHALIFLFDGFSEGVYVEEVGLTPFPLGTRIDTVTHKGRVQSMQFKFPEIDPITVSFQHWKEEGDRAIPYQARIDDGRQIYTYDYDKVEFEAMTDLEFVSALPGNVPADVRLYRLHRALLAAHCLGDADLMAELSADEMVYVSNGSRRIVTQDQMRSRFETVFDDVNYQSYSDLALPIIEVSEDGTFGVAHVTVRAEGETADGPFSQDWAWALTARKFDDGWKHTGNSSSAKISQR